MRGFIILMVIGLIIIGSAMSALMAGGAASLLFGANPHTSTYYANVNITRAGLPSGTLWSGYIYETQGQTPGLLYNFNTTATYYNATMDVYDFPAQISWVVQPVGPIRGNVWYEPTPSTGSVTAYTPSGNTLNVTVTYSQVVGYPVNITAYNLITPLFFNGSVSNKLNAHPVIHYFSTGSNQVQFILPNGTWFLDLNNSTYLGFRYVPEVQQLIFSIQGASYSIQVNYIDRSPGEQLYVFFNSYGLSKGTNWSIVVNGTQYTTANSSLSIFLPVGIYPFYAQATGYTYTGNTSINVGTGSVDINVSFISNSNQGVGSALADMLNPIGISVSGFLVAVSLGITMFTAGFVYAVTRHEAMMAATMAVIPWILYGIGFIGLAVPFYFILVAVAAYVAPKLLPGGLST